MPFFLVKDYLKTQGGEGYRVNIPAGSLELGRKAPAWDPHCPVAPPLRWIKWSGLAAKNSEYKRPSASSFRVCSGPLLSTTKLLGGGQWLNGTNRENTPSQAEATH